MNTTLCGDECAISGYIADRRRGNNRAKGAVNQKASGKSEFDTDYEGFAGEMAFAKIMNVYPDFRISVRAGSADCVVNGVPVDVKTHPDYGEWNWLMVTVPETPNESVDVYALMVHTGRDFKFVGWCTREAIIQPGLVRTSIETRNGTKPLEAPAYCLLVRPGVLSTEEIR